MMCSLIGDLIIRSLKSLSRVQVRTLPVSTMRSPLLQSCDFRLVYHLLHMDYSGPSSLHRGNPALHPTSHMDLLSPQVLLTWVRREKPCLTRHLCLESLNCRSHSITHKQNWGETSQCLTLACLSPTKYTDDIGILMACH